MSRKKKKQALNAEEDFATPAKQERLAGMQDAAIEEIEAQASKVKAIEQRRMTLLRQEMDAREVLGDIMAKHGRARYRFHGWLVTTTETKPKVKVQRYEEEEDGSDAVSDNANPGGANTSSEDSAPTGDQESTEVAGASTEGAEETLSAGTEEGGEDQPF